MDKPKIEIGAPKVQFEDHDSNFTMFNVEVKRANLDNHWEAKIQVAGLKPATFVARHTSRSQAISDVQVAAREAHRRGQIVPGVQ